VFDTIKFTLLHSIPTIITNCPSLNSLHWCASMFACEPACSKVCEWVSKCAGEHVCEEVIVCQWVRVYNHRKINRQAEVSSLPWTDKVTTAFRSGSIPCTVYRPESLSWRELMDSSAEERLNETLPW
jgi:hypothetical protein